MSAITGIGEKRTIFGSASASSPFGTATRTISQPALASAAICAVVASTSCVFVSVIDCTTGGAPPPILTPPTVTERSLATAPGYPPVAPWCLTPQVSDTVSQPPPPNRSFRRPKYMSTAKSDSPITL